MNVHHNIPIKIGIVQSLLDKYQIGDLGKATIREIVSIVNDLEEITGVQFVRMEMGVPGLPASKIGVDAEIEALKNDAASKYPMIEGEPHFKEEASKFIKAFLDVDVDRSCCIPTVGTMQGSFACFFVLGVLNPKKDTFLFIDPGFPAQQLQLKVMGYKYETFDVYHHRGQELRGVLESYLSKGNISTIVYSNPNNPTWICFHEDELQIIGELATKYDTVVVEDLAYFAMDFRTDLSVPFQAPFQPTIARYTNNYILLISSSKVFSYAGQRIGTLCISPALFGRKYDTLKQRFGIATFGRVITGRLLYAMSAGTSHSSQFAIAAIYKAAVEGEYHFLSDVKEYGRRAKLMKQLFLKFGFQIIYDKDMDEPIADGFYFTIGYKNLTSGELLEKLLSYGVSAIGLGNTGSEMEGVRICVSQTAQNGIGNLSNRLEMLHVALSETE